MLWPRCSGSPTGASSPVTCPTFVSSLRLRPCSIPGALGSRCSFMSASPCCFSCWFVSAAQRRHVCWLYSALWCSCRRGSRRGSWIRRRDSAAPIMVRTRARPSFSRARCLACGWRGGADLNPGRSPRQVTVAARLRALGRGHSGRFSVCSAWACWVWLGLPCRKGPGASSAVGRSSTRWPRSVSCGR